MFPESGKYTHVVMSGRQGLDVNVQRWYWKNLIKLTIFLDNGRPCE